MRLEPSRTTSPSFEGVEGVEGVFVVVVVVLVVVFVVVTVVFEVVAAGVEPLLWRTIFVIVTSSSCGHQTIALMFEPAFEGIV